MKKLLVSLVIGLIPVIAIMFIFWVGGREFVRGEPLAEASLISVLCFVWMFAMSYCYPGWKD